MKPTGLNSRDSWLATMACTLISFLTMMPAKLSGLIFVEILGRYNTDRLMASYPLFLSMLVRCSGGPLTGYCGERFGLYAVTMTGSILSALGIGVCFLAEEMTTVIIFLGLVYGLGLSFSTTLFPQIIKTHFDKNLTLAISMTMFGACFGGFIIPPLIKWIFRSYGVSGTFLIMGGIMLNGVPAAMLLMYLKPKKKPAQSNQKEATPLVAEIEEPVVPALKCTPKIIENDKDKNAGEEKEYCVWEIQDKCKMALSSSPNHGRPAFTSLNNGFPTNSTQFQSHLIQNKEPINDKDTLEQATKLLPKSLEPEPENSEKKISPETKPVDKIPVLKQKAALQSLRIFLDFTFLTMLITQSTEVIIQMLTLTTMLDYSRDKGIDRSYEVYFLMSLPLAEVIGRVIISVILDKNCITKLNFTILSFILLAGIVLMMIWAKTFAVMLIGVLLFGFINSGLLSVFPMLIFQFMEPKNYIMALASKASLYGPMSFLCSPLIGYFRGSRGSYDWVYYIQAILSVVCAVLTMMTPYLAKRRDRINEKKREKSKRDASINA